MPTKLTSVAKDTKPQFVILSREQSILEQNVAQIRMCITTVPGGPQVVLQCLTLVAWLEALPMLEGMELSTGPVLMPNRVIKEVKLWLQGYQVCQESIEFPVLLI